MKFTIVTSIVALASFGMAAPSAAANPAAINEAIAAYDNIASFAKRAPASGLDKRGPCPAAGSGNIDPCCNQDGPDKNCRSQSNCYTRCGPGGPNDNGGPLGCIVGCTQACPSKLQC